MSSSTGSTPDTDSIDAPATTTAGTTSSNLALLYIIIAVLVGVLLYMAVRYGTSALHEWRERNGTGVGGHGALLGSDLGLSTDDITALPTFTYRSRAPMTPSSQTSRCGGGGKSKGRDQAAAVECVVCLQELVDGDVVRVLPACRHFFHGGCIDVWLRKRSSCPVCRAYPEPEAGARLGELSPPLPQLRRCGVSPERHPTSASRILADILARSPLRIGSSSAAKEEVILSRSASPMPTATAGDYVLSRSPPQAPLAHSASSETLEILVVRSKPPSPIRFGRQSTTRCVGVLERTDVIRSASASPATSRAQW